MFVIRKSIEIDAAHRVPGHAGKCASLHGHRYRITAEVAGCLASSGREEGMVVDFGDLRTLMDQEITHRCDHGLLMWRDDPLLWRVLGLSSADDLAGDLARNGTLRGTDFGRVEVVPFVPTAEELARYWSGRLAAPVGKWLAGRGRLAAVEVRETPSSVARHER